MYNLCAVCSSSQYFNTVDLVLERLTSPSCMFRYFFCRVEPCFSILFVAFPDYTRFVGVTLPYSVLVNAVDMQ